MLIGLVAMALLLSTAANAQLCQNVGLNSTQQQQWVQGAVMSVFSQVMGDSSPLLQYFDGSRTATDYIQSPSALVQLVEKYVTRVGSLLQCSYTTTGVGSLNIADAHRPLAVRNPHFAYYVDLLATALVQAQSLNETYYLLIRSALISDSPQIVYRSSVCDYQSDITGQLGSSNFEVMENFISRVITSTLSISALKAYYQGLSTTSSSLPDSFYSLAYLWSACRP